MEENSQEELPGSLDKREQREAHRGEHKAQGDELRLAERLDEPANGAPLHESADDAAVNKEIGDGAGGSWVVLEVEVEVLADQQRQSALETAKAKRGQKEHTTRNPILGRRKRVEPLVEVRALGNVGGAGLAALGENEEARAGNSPRTTRRRSNPGRCCRDSGG